MLQPCALIRKTEIEQTLATPPAQGKRLLDPLKSISAASGMPMNILEDHEVTNEAEVHRHEGDLWHCVEGEAMFIYGGEMVDPSAKKLADGGVDDREIKAKEILNGTETALEAGDWLWIPAGQPHVHHAKGTARMFIIKIPAKELVPLDQVPGWQ